MLKSIWDCPAQKHLGFVLDSKLTFNEHTNRIFSKVNESIALLRKFQSVLPRSSLPTIYTFIRSHFEYVDVAYELKLQVVVSGKTWVDSRGSSSEKLYQKLGLESLQNRRWFRKLCQFHKILKSKSPRYLFNSIPTKLRVHNTRYCDNILLLKIKYNYFRNSFFPSSIVEWNKISREGRNSENITIFKKRLLEFIRPSPNSIFDIYSPHGIKFKQGFNDTINSIRICGGNTKSKNDFWILWSKGNPLWQHSKLW